MRSLISNQINSQTDKLTLKQLVNGVHLPCLVLLRILQPHDVAQHRSNPDSVLFPVDLNTTKFEHRVELRFSY